MTIPLWVWIVIAILAGLYFCTNHYRKKKASYFRAVMAALQEKGFTSGQLLEKLAPDESGKMLAACYRKKMPPAQAADVLLDKYNRHNSP